MAAAYRLTPEKVAKLDPVLAGVRDQIRQRADGWAPPAPRDRQDRPATPTND